MCSLSYQDSPKVKHYSDFSDICDFIKKSRKLFGTQIMSTQALKQFVFTMQHNRNLQGNLYVQSATNRATNLIYEHKILQNILCLYFCTPFNYK